MADFTQIEKERVSRHRAAERLIDIAYALAAGSPYELRVDDQRMRVPIGDEVRLEWTSKSRDNRLEFELELRWSACEAELPARVAARSPT